MSFDNHTDFIMRFVAGVALAAIFLVIACAVLGVQWLVGR